MKDCPDCKRYREALEDIVQWFDEYTDNETLDRRGYFRPVELVRQARAALSPDPKP